MCDYASQDLESVWGCDCTACFCSVSPTPNPTVSSRPTTFSPTLPDPWMCTFDDGTCGFRTIDGYHEFAVGNLNSDHGFNTGPSFDHTPGKNGLGNYMYMEVSGPNTRRSLAAPR